MSSDLPSNDSRWASIRRRQRRNGTTSYSVLFWSDGRQSSLTFDAETHAEALRCAIKAHGAETALQMHGIDHHPRSPMTVAQWVRHHIDHLTGVEQYTLDCYERYLRLDITPHLGDIPLAALTGEDIARWVKRMETEPSAKTGRVVAPKTIKNKHGFLSGALAAAAAKGLIPANPAAGRRLPRKTGDSDDDEPGELRMLSRDEFDRLVSATPESWRPLLQFLVASGCRWGEATALKPADVDQSTGTVAIRRAWKYSSKGYHIGPPKTRRSRRIINLPAGVLDQLDYSGVWLFGDRGRPVRYHIFKPQVWNRAVASAKLDPKPTPHDLRHTCASWMLAEGVPLTTVSRLLGHESIKITADIYTDVDRASHQAAADVMGRILAGSACHPFGGGLH